MRGSKEVSLGVNSSSRDFNRKETQKTQKGAEEFFAAMKRIPTRRVSEGGSEQIFFAAKKAKKAKRGRDEFQSDWNEKALLDSSDCSARQGN